MGPGRSSFTRGDMMTAEREPLARWRYPTRGTLKGNIFPSGKPPLAPFPTVTNMMNASLCSVAVYHDLLHGIDNALLGQYPFKRRGDLFQKFITYLKSSIRNGGLQISSHDIQAQLGMIQDLFLRFSQRYQFSIDESSDLWRLYVSPWVSRKLRSGELTNISNSDQIFFEFSLSNARVPFTLGSGERNYPLRGRIDEIDLTGERLIERTIKGEPDGVNPPFLKDYQIWLLWKILCSLDTSQLPHQWSSVDFQNFNLIVETPFEDFVVSKNNPTYLSDTHYAYSWINDISISESPGVFREVFDCASCTPINPHTECGHKFMICFPNNYPYPQCRPEIKQIFKPWYRLLLWEQIWEGHLFHYQLAMLDRNELSNLGLIWESRILSVTGDRIELEVTDERTLSMRGYDNYIIIPSGTLFCGKKMNSTLMESSSRHLILQIETDQTGLAGEALLLPLQPDASPPIMQEPPIYLKQQTQEALLRLQNSGVIKPESARTKSIVQLLEGIFGMRRLRRGSQ